jgi:hypothetical protein
MQLIPSIDLPLHGSTACENNSYSQFIKRILAQDRIKRLYRKGMDLFRILRWKVIWFFFLILIDLSCLSLGWRPHIPIAPLGDRKHWVLVSCPTSKLEDFRKSTNQKFISHFEENSISYLVFSRSIWESMDKTNLPLKEETGNFGFKFFAENYNYQMNKSVFDLSDLRLGYKDNLLNQKYLSAITNAYRDKVTLHTIGNSQSGLPILALKITNDLSSRANQTGVKLSVLFSCALHANEVTTTDHCYDIIYTLLSNKELDPYLQNLDIWVIPISNPDGSSAFWNLSHLNGRKNLIQNNNKGVDLNRNFPFHWGKSGSEYSSDKSDSPYYRGKEEASEPETRSLMRFFSEQKVIASISYHAFANALLYPYSVEGYINPQPDIAEQIGKKMVSMAKNAHPTKRFQLRKNIYPIDGVDQDYYFNQYGTLAYILESSHFNPEYSSIPMIMDAYRGVWTKLLEEISMGEKIIFKIQSETGSPIEAKVELNTHKYFHVEPRKSHPKTGIFYHHTIVRSKGIAVIEADGYEKKEIPFKSKSTWIPETIILQRTMAE